MSIKIVIADDHAVLREGLRLLLETQENISVVGEAVDGRQVVELVRQLNPDVVLMDISMPELNGIEATRQIKANHPAVKVVILSIHGTNEHIFRSFEAGANGYLLKESTSKEVVAAVCAAYAGHRYLSQQITESVVDDYLQQRQTNTFQSPLTLLSSREREVLQLVAEGKTSAEIAGILYISPKTVDTYRSRLMQKLDIKDIPNLVRFAIQNGLISIE